MDKMEWCIPQFTPLRRRIVLRPDIKKGMGFGDNEKESEKSLKNSKWAKNLARTFEIDVKICTKCGGELYPVAVIKDHLEAARYLKHAGLPMSSRKEHHLNRLWSDFRLKHDNPSLKQPATAPFCDNGPSKALLTTQKIRKKTTLYISSWNLRLTLDLLNTLTLRS